MLKVIKSDLFNISSQLTKINKNLFVIYNKKKSQYEVHSKNYKPNTLVFCLGKHLTNIAIKKAYLTSPKFALKTIKQINKQNQVLQNKQQQELISKHTQTLNSYLKYANKKNCDVTFN